MKKLIYILILALFVSFSTIEAQDKLSEDEVKSALTKIFDLSKNKNYSEVAKYLLNERSNTVKAYNFTNAKESKIVKRLVKKIKAYLDLSDSYEYESIEYTSEKKLPAAKLKVNFISGDQELTITFSFLKSGKTTLLSDFK